MKLIVSDDVPEIFCRLYAVSFDAWVREFAVRGYYQMIPFIVPPWVETRETEEGFLEQRGKDGEWYVAGAWFEGHWDAGPMAGSALEPRLVVSPRRLADKAAIRRHCRDMARHVLQ